MSIHQLISDGDINVLAHALRSSPDIVNTCHQSGISPLIYAMYYKRKDMAKIIASHIPSLSFDEMIAMGETKKVSALISEDPSLLSKASVDGFYPIHYAAFFKECALLNIIVNAGSALNVPARNKSAVHPIHTAIAAQDFACSKLLIDAGCDVNAQQKGGWTALMAAAKFGRRDLIDLLLSAGAKIHMTADDGKTAIDIADGASQTITALYLEQSVKGA